MESELDNVADFALSQPGVTGYICVDNEGLCLAAKGQVNQSISGVVHQLTELANKIEDHSQSEERPSPVIRVDLERHKMIIHSRDSITTALISPQK